MCDVFRFYFSRQLLMERCTPASAPSLNVPGAMDTPPPSSRLHFPGCQRSPCCPDGLTCWESIYFKRHFTSGFDVLGLLPININ